MVSENLSGCSIVNISSQVSKTADFLAKLPIFYCFIGTFMGWVGVGGGESSQNPEQLHPHPIPTPYLSLSLSLALTSEVYNAFGGGV
jgi:hypothetical protein